MFLIDECIRSIADEDESTYTIHRAHLHSHAAGSERRICEYRSVFLPEKVQGLKEKSGFKSVVQDNTAAIADGNCKVFAGCFVDNKQHSRCSQIFVRIWTSQIMLIKDTEILITNCFLLHIPDITVRSKLNACCNSSFGCGSCTGGFRAAVSNCIHQDGIALVDIHKVLIALPHGKVTASGNSVKDRIELHFNSSFVEIRIRSIELRSSFITG